MPPALSPQLLASRTTAATLVAARAGAVAVLIVFVVGCRDESLPAGPLTLPPADCTIDVEHIRDFMESVEPHFSGIAEGVYPVWNMAVPIRAGHSYRFRGFLNDAGLVVAGYILDVERVDYERWNGQRRNGAILTIQVADTVWGVVEPGTRIRVLYTEDVSNQRFSKVKQSLLCSKGLFALSRYEDNEHGIEYSLWLYDFVLGLGMWDARGYVGDSLITTQTLALDAGVDELADVLRQNRRNTQPKSCPLFAFHPSIPIEQSAAWLRAYDEGIIPTRYDEGESRYRVLRGAEESGIIVRGTIEAFAGEAVRLEPGENLPTGGWVPVAQIRVHQRLRGDVVPGDVVRVLLPLAMPGPVEAIGERLPCEDVLVFLGSDASREEGVSGQPSAEGGVYYDAFGGLLLENAIGDIVSPYEWAYSNLFIPRPWYQTYTLDEVAETFGE